jgi:PTS system nitrogen regulatory IIA component
MQFGAALRLLRIDAGFSLRALAQKIGVSSAYLSRVENGLDAVPTPERLLALARELQVSPGLLVELAHQVGPFLTEYLERQPSAASLFIEIARRNYGATELARIRAFLDSELPVRGSKRDSFGLVHALENDRIVLDLSCSAYDDLLDVVATRMVPVGKIEHPRDLAERLRAREAEGGTFLGNGVAVPHAIVPGAKPTAVLVTLARPLRADTPDGEPLGVVVALVCGAGGHDHLERLAHVARIASHDYAGELRTCRSPRQIFERLAEIDEGRAQARGRKQT